ncbi:1-(5-phosphoribosyl)-5-[(5-phosphoribosylamino) methylideneamino] imidazole-4-carboxamide isomerase [bacterium HR37]|nr:1-(5-phosphoribosyl)-5-[(5-phosphoribosylamino) methylideneamino] imidazole-4-carboxamide isomerase [bacterium HR37]
MLVIPAIDLKGGKCVRLLKGEEGTEVVFSEDPVETAKKWERCGAELIHVVDLDGAFLGEPRNLDTIRDIRDSVSVDIQVGGGIRSIETVRRYFDIGINRVIIGTAAFKDPQFLSRVCREFPGRVAVGVDTKGGKLALYGWKAVADFDLEVVLKGLFELGVSLLIHTDVDRDGTMEGINTDSIKRFLSLSPIPVIASGGIASIRDLELLSALEDLGLIGVILGKSIYTGRIDLKEAIDRFS